MHVWKYLGDENYPGYNFAGTSESCQQLVESLQAFLVKRVVGERLILNLSPVTRRVLRNVNCSSQHKSFLTVIVNCRESSEFGEQLQQLQLCLCEEDLHVLISALKAMRDGVGDFDALDGPIYFWPIRAK